jgi:hypothetical protein
MRLWGEFSLGGYDGIGRVDFVDVVDVVAGFRVFFGVRARVVVEPDKVVVCIF